MHRHAVILGILLALAPRNASAQGRVIRVQEPRTQQLRFAEKHPLSNLEELTRRTEFDPRLWPDRPRQEWQYEIGDESFEVFVPGSYRRGVPHGLFVFLPPSDAPAPRGWLDAIGRRKLIWVSPRNAGNSRGWPIRLFLAMDAVHNMMKRYEIDEGRIFVAGYSGGGSMSSILIRGFPEVFRGAFCMNGYSFVGTRRRDDGREEPTLYLRPWHGDLERIRKDVRLVLLDGEGDPMTGPGGSRAACEGLRLEGFERVRWLEVPKLGHRQPDAAWFAKGLVALEAEAQPSPTTRPTKEPNPGPGQAAQARRILASALSSLEDSKERGRAPWPAARTYLERVVEQYPTTESARKARALLREHFREAGKRQGTRGQGEADQAD